MLPLVYKVRVSDDPAALVLPEYLSELHSRNDAAADNGGEHIAGADGRKLIRIADHHKARVIRQRAQKRVDKRDIDHGAFVEYDRAAVEPVTFVLCEHDALAVLRELRPKQPVHGDGILSAELTHALGGAPCRRGQQCFQPKRVKHCDYGADGRRFARARPAGNHDELVFKRKLQRLPLEGRIFYPLPLFYSGDQRGDVHILFIFSGAHFRHMRRGVCLRLVYLRQIAGLALCYLLIAYLSGLDKLVYAVVDLIRLNAYKLRRDGGKLFARDKAMAVIKIMPKHKKRSGVYSVAAVSVQPHFQRKRVRFGKAAADMAGRKYVRVFTQKLQRVVAVEFIHAHGEYRPYPEGTDEFHYPAHTGLTAEIL